MTDCPPDLEDRAMAAVAASIADLIPDPDLRRRVVAVVWMVVPTVQGAVVTAGQETGTDSWADTRAVRAALEATGLVDDALLAAALNPEGSAIAREDG